MVQRGPQRQRADSGSVLYHHCASSLRSVIDKSMFGNSRPVILYGNFFKTLFSSVSSARVAVVCYMRAYG